MKNLSISYLDHVALEVHDLKIAMEFYTEIIGLALMDTPESVKSKGVRWLRLNDRQALHLVENKKAVPAQIAHIAFNVEEVQAWKNKLEKSGVIFYSPKFSVYEADRFFILDPSQNRIEFVKWLA